MNKKEIHCLMEKYSDDRKRRWKKIKDHRLKDPTECVETLEL